MDVAVPFDAVDPKTRLEGLFEDAERRALAETVLEDVVAAIRASGREPTVYATAAVDLDAEVVVDERGLDPLVASLTDEPPIAIVMADLALATPEAFDRLFDTEGDVVAAPGLGGGTNALVVRNPAFEPDFHGTSISDHRQAVRDAGLDWTAVDSMRLAVDVDEPTDLVEVLLHGEGRTPDWLRDHGVSLAIDGGRARVVREE